MRSKGAPEPAGPTAQIHLSAVVVALGATALFAYGSLVQGRDSGAGIVVAPLLFAAVAVIVARVRVPTIPDCASLLTLSFAIRLVATYFRYLTGKDSREYHQVGQRLASSFRRFEFAVDPERSVPGTGAVRYFTGLVHLVTGSNYVATFLVYSFIGFWGMYFFVRAFCIAVPDGRHRRFARLVLFWPSLLYWPTSIGKEALVVFGLGLAAYGFACVLRRQRFGLLLMALGLAAVTMIRPHVALIVVTASFVPLLLRRRNERRGSGLGKVVALAALVVLGALTAHQTEQRLNIEDLSGSSIVEQLTATTAQTTQGSAQFSAATASSPIDYPWAFVTVVFRPLPIEARSLQMMLSSGEALVLGLLMLRELSRYSVALLQVREAGFVWFSTVFVLIFVYLFSSIGNFGILVRQRVQMVPFLLVGLALADQRLREPKRGRRRTVKVAAPHGQ